MRISTSIKITQDGETSPATVMYQSEWGKVAVVIDAAGMINDFETIRYLAAVVSYLLSVHTLTTAHDPDVKHIAATAEKLMLCKSMQLGEAMTAVSQLSGFAGLQLRKGWNYPGWLVEYDPAKHGDFT